MFISSLHNIQVNRIFIEKIKINYQQNSVPRIFMRIYSYFVYSAEKYNFTERKH